MNMPLSAPAPRDGLRETLRNRLATLTPAEREVLSMIIEGYTQGQIAAARGKSIRTIEMQVDSARKRLGAKNSVCMVIIAVVVGGYDPDLANLTVLHACE